MTRTCAILTLLLLAAQAPAESPMNGAAFDAYTRGKTLFFGKDGEAYGVERYLDGQRVIWSFLDGQCKNGIWYEESGEICFVYEDRPDPQCWVFRQGPSGLIAQFSGETLSLPVYEAQDTGEEMLCYGPDTGV